MKSTDNHINDQNVLDINMLDVIREDFCNYVKYTTIEQYDLMSEHDERTVYIARCAGADDRVFLGSREIAIEKSGRKYFISYNHKTMKYELYLNEITVGYNKMVPIASYNDPEMALKAMVTYNKIGDHAKVFMNILDALSSYLIKDIGMNDLIISIISIVGYRDDSRLQYLNELSIKYNDDKLGRDISQFHREMLHNQKDAEPETLVGLYSDIYDVFVEFDLFKQYKLIDDIDYDTMRKFSRKLLETVDNVTMGYFGPGIIRWPMVNFEQDHRKLGVH